MHRIRLFTAALVSRVDGMVSRIENHEAVAHSAIRDVRRQAARASVQLRRVQRDGERLRAQERAAREAVETWRERARATSGEDEARALECLRRSKCAEREASSLAERLAEHERAERQLARDVGRVEERLARLEEHRNVLATRQTRADALASVRDAEGPLPGDLDDVFERWEARVAETEYEGGCRDRADAFEASFTSEEETADLRAELAALREGD